MSDFIYPEDARLIELCGTRASESVYAIVDTEDYAELSIYRWSLSNSGYAVRSAWENGRNKLVLMHHQIAGKPIGGVTDHINGNRLDNRQTNLRFATFSQNSQNTVLHVENSTRYQGVHKHGLGYRAVVWAEGKRYRSRTFYSPEEAHQIYLGMRKTLHGEFDRSNRM